MEQIVISPVQWSSLSDIEAVPPINAEDFECLREVRNVLKKHGSLDRFGVALLHSHFDLQPGEAWLEESDEDGRKLITRVVPEAEASDGNVGTIWQLRDGDFLAMSWCRKYCYDGLFGHSKRHNTVPGR